MKAISNRLRRLEARVAPQENLQSWRIANSIHESRRRRAEAAGISFNDQPPEARPRGPRLTIAETIRRRRQELQQQKRRPIVGVVNTIRFRNPRQPGRPMFFLPLLQMKPKEWEDTTMARSNVIENIVLRVNGAVPDLAPRVQRTLAGIDPNLTMLRVTPTSELLDEELSHAHLIGSLAQVFGILALLLASVGLYGITAYSVARRTREIGVRAALGATRARVIGMILTGALAQAIIGLAIGIPASLAAGRFLAGQLFGVKASDPGILTLAAAALVTCALIAGLIPALRASTVDPAKALRVEN